VAIIVVIGLAGWGLRQWGFVNPAIDVTSYVVSSQGNGPPTTQVTVADESSSAVDITGVVAVPGQFAQPGGSPRVARVDGFTWVPDGPGSARQGPVGPLPVHVPGHGRAELEVTLSQPFCGTHPDSTSGDYSLAVQIRTSSGRSKTVSATGPLPTVTCTDELPRGNAPTDRADRAAIISAYTTVYDSSRPAATRLALIDDPTGVALATQHALAGPYGSAARHAAVQITDVEVDRPGHAWVDFDLYTGVAANPVLRGRLGQAHLVDDTWKVARSTVCADLALAGATCHPA
jgi:hypothetical protein